jgi:hypothetical protein
LPELDADGRLAAEQVLDVSRMPPTDTGTMLVAPGALRDERLRAGPFDVTLAIPIGGAPVLFSIRDAELRATRTPEGWTEGVLAGRVDHTQIHPRVRRPV